MIGQPAVAVYLLRAGPKESSLLPDYIQPMLVLLRMADMPAVRRELIVLIAPEYQIKIRFVERVLLVSK